MGVFDKFFDPPAAEDEPVEEVAPSDGGDAVAQVLAALLDEREPGQVTGQADRQSAAPLSKELVPLLMQRGFTSSIGYLDDDAVSMAREAMEDGIYAGDRAGLFTWLHAQERAAINAGFPRSLDGLLAYRKATKRSRDS